MNNQVFVQFDRISGSGWFPIVFTGALVSGFGLAILYHPELLVVLVSAFFIFVGMSVMALGLTIRRASRNQISRNFFE